MVMKTLCFQRSLLAFAVILLVAGNHGRATEPTSVPSFHRVLVVNDTSRPAVTRTENGFLTAALETNQPDGQWRAIARLRVPSANANLALSSGEVWQFIVPDFGPASPAKVRLAVKVADRIIYSQPFAANVDPFAPNQTIDCWLARLRVQPARSEDGSMIAVVGPTPGN